MTSVSQTPGTEPLLQIFVMPEGLKTRKSQPLRVVCYMDAREAGDERQELARTEVLRTRDPLFKEPLELWGEASGRGSSRMLTFEVQEAAPGADVLAVLAVAKSSSDELRRFGRSVSSAQGVAIALPLRSETGDVLAGARLQIYVHAGDGRRDPASDASRAQRTSLDAQPGAEAKTSSTVADDRSARHMLQIHLVQRPTVESGTMLLLASGRNASDALLRLRGFELQLPYNAPWELLPSCTSHLLRNVVVPPGGQFREAFTLRYRARASHGHGGGDAAALDRVAARAEGSGGGPTVRFAEQDAKEDCVAELLARYEVAAEDDDDASGAEEVTYSQLRRRSTVPPPPLPASFGVAPRPSDTTDGADDDADGATPLRPNVAAGFSSASLLGDDDGAGCCSSAMGGRLSSASFATLGLETPAAVWSSAVPASMLFADLDDPLGATAAAADEARPGAGTDAASCDGGGGGGGGGGGDGSSSSADGTGGAASSVDGGGASAGSPGGDGAAASSSSAAAAVAAALLTPPPRPGNGLVRHLRVSLAPPWRCSPVIATVRSVLPAPLRVGNFATLEVAFSLQPGAAAALGSHGPSPASPSAGPAPAPARSTELLLQARAAEEDWVMLGAHHQQRLSIPVDGTEGAEGGGAAVVRWQLLPLRDGHVPLPQLAVWTILGGGQGGLVMVGEPLPPPAIIGGTTVKVLPSD